MFDRKKFKNILAEKGSMSWADREDDYRMSKLWREMTAEEYVYLSEISDEISQKKPSHKFVEAYKFLAKKYPVETKDYQMMSFIEVAEAWAEDEK